MITKTEWEVAWFPPDKPDQSKTYEDEGKARRRFSDALAEHHAPILSKRVVRIEIDSWEIVESATRP